MLSTVILTSAAALVVGTPAFQESTITNPQDSGFAKQTSNGRVTLELWPQWRDNILAVQVRANTHAVDLGTVNLSEQVRLVVAGTEITPVSAGPLSGHHAVAEVVFRLATRPSSFAITIRDVPDVPVRVVTWPPANLDSRP